MDIWIDNRHYKVKETYTIFQYCAKIGINLPCFCYHERLSIAGNCRMCLVESNSALVVSCATLLIDKMNIFTKNKRVKKAREGVLEFILANHPLDCPICDQGGECDLQDIFLIFGSDRGRFYDMDKKSVTNLNCVGPFVKTIMTRCIHCTRCVRFLNEISGIQDFGIIGRGSSMEIGTYIKNNINDELLGNIIDLCPVGALTSMPIAFKGRVWELKYIQSIDIFDSIGTNIRIGVTDNSINRIIPSLDDFYDEWITNKARFIYDSFNIHRLYYPKLKLNTKFITVSWKFALLLFLYLYNNKYKNNIAIYCGPFLSIELSITLKSLINSLGCSNILYFENTIYNFDFRYSFLLNTTIKELVSINDVLLIGFNPRIEVPLLNSQLRKNYINNLNFSIYSIGLALNNSTYPIINTGNSIKNLYKFLMGITLVSKNLLFKSFYNTFFFNANLNINPYIFLGSSTLIRKDSDCIIQSILNFFFDKKLPLTMLNIIPRHLGRISFAEYSLNGKLVNLTKF